MAVRLPAVAVIRDKIDHEKKAARLTAGPIVC